MMRQWASIGVRNVERAGFTERHTLVESFDYIALPKLLQEGARFDFAFIDGMHLFDYTLLDFFFVDVMLDVGGWVIVVVSIVLLLSLSLPLSLLLTLPFLLPPPHTDASCSTTARCQQSTISSPTSAPTAHTTSSRATLASRLRAK